MSKFGAEVEAKKIVWDKPGKRGFRYGISHGVFYKMNDDGTYQGGRALDGLRNVNDSPDGGDVNKYYADNIEYFTTTNRVNWKGSFGLYDYPPEFAECLGEAELAPGLLMSQQDKKKFAFCYRNELGTDATTKKGYELHIVYNCLATTPQVNHETVNENLEPGELDYDYEATAYQFKDSTGKDVETAHICLSSLTVPEGKLAAIEEILYGKDPVTGESPVEGVAPKLLMPEEIAAIINAN